MIIEQPYESPTEHTCNMCETLNDIEQRVICVNCIGEKFLKHEVESRGASALCFYCDNIAHTISIADVADYVHDVFAHCFERTPDEPSYYESAMMADKDNGRSDYEWVRLGDEVAYVIAAIAEIENAPAEDVRQILETAHYDLEQLKMGKENPFDENAHYLHKHIDDEELRISWQTMQRDIKYETRFFNSGFKSFLDSIFEHISQHTQGTIIDVGPGCDIDHIYRARVFHSDDDIRKAFLAPSKGLGPPPSSNAIAGRMNAQGISVFYGATNPEIAIHEVRPPVGSRVIVARFDIVGHLRLFNIESLASIFDSKDISIFDPSYMENLEMSVFLKRLRSEIIKPVTPEDKQLDYVITQAIFDYLATQPSLITHGIMYSTGQTNINGYNIALFHRSSVVEQLDISNNKNAKTTIRFSDFHFFYRHDYIDSYEDGVHYSVYGNIDKANSLPPPIMEYTTSGDYLRATRHPMLKVDETTMKVHHITNVSIASEEYPVSWNLYTDG